MANPIQQGLKLPEPSFMDGLFQAAMANPIQQGLKRSTLPAIKCS